MSRLQPTRTLALTMIVVALVPAAHGQQQQNNPHAGYVYPAGAERGSRVQVSVGGQFLDGVTGALMSGDDVQAAIVGHDKPLTQREITDLRDRAQEMVKNASDPASRNEVADIRERIGDSLRRNTNPTISEFVTLEITIASNAEPGPRFLRLATPLGLTNPVVFVVGQLQEFRELDAKSSPGDAELAVTIPAVVNGRLIPGDVDRAKFPLRQAPQYMPGDVDRYRFAARKGQHLVFIVSARDLVPYLADAVPGWLQATLALVGPNGREVAYEDDYRFHPDPVLHYEVPEDGEYVIQIRDALYRGREDFVYRIAMGELPFVTSAFPLGGRAGTRTSVQVEGWNLPSSALAMDGTKKAPGIYSVSTARADLVSNRLPFAMDALPEALEREPNGSSKDAQAVKLPVIVNGRVQPPGDSDVFSFQGRAGDDVVAEVQARRLESPLDSAIELTDAAGRRVAFNDDADDKGSGLLTHHADSFVTARLPATGTYFLRLWDVQHKGGAEFAYRLRISAPQPDFRVWIAPSSINAPGGGTVPVTVGVRRLDGFSGDIALALDGAPDGFTLSGGLVPAGQDQVRLTLTAPPAVGPNTQRPPVRVKLDGRATINGRSVVRKAAPADDMMQAFAYRHLVPADDLRVAVTARGGTRVSARILAPDIAKIRAGGTVPVKALLPPGYRTFENLQLELSAPPDGVTIGSVSIEGADVTFVLQADGAKAKVGLRGNLIVTVSGERVPPAAAQQPKPPRRRIVLGSLPAIPFEIVS